MNTKINEVKTKVADIMENNIDDLFANQKKLTKFEIQQMIKIAVSNMVDNVAKKLQVNKVKK